MGWRRWGWGLVLAATPALADVRVQRVTPPPVVVPGLSRVVLAGTLEAKAPVARQGLAAALRTRLGLSGGGAIEEGLSTGFVDYAEDVTRAVPTAVEVVALARRHGAQAVAVLAASGAETLAAKRTEQRTVVDKDKDGNLTTREVTVDCFRREVEASFLGVLYGAADGVELARVPVVRTVADDDCDEPGQDVLAVRSASELVDSGVTDAAFTFAYRFVPSWETVGIDLPRDPATRDAVRAADGGDWRTAVDLSLGVLVDDAYNAMAVNVVGAAHEVVGRYDEAYALYRLAARLRDDRPFRNAVGRASSRLDELEVLREAYGQEQVPRGTWESASALVERARAAGSGQVLGVAAVIKGARGKRVPVFASQDPTSAMVALVPGGTGVRRVRTVGGLTEIQLPDGALGWVSSKEVK
jgi:hypothetical protein